MNERLVRTVREFTSGMGRWFAQHRQLQDLAISGEISNLHEFGGHLAFALKEEQALLECVVWSEYRFDLPELRNGLQAIAIGSLRVRPERSGYHLIVEAVELTGVGALYQLFERLKEQFRREGLFEPARKRAVPALPRRVALVSARGKAMQDFVETIERSVPFVHVEFIETRVQGMGAEIEIAAALDDASRRSVDVIVLTRGGGSYEDLFPFNLEPVIRAIVRAKQPVLTAIGHSGDHHLADAVADLTFGTPSLAAEHIAKGWLLANQRLHVAQRDLIRAARTTLLRATQSRDGRVRELDRSIALALSEKARAVSVRVTRLSNLNPQRAVTERRASLARLTGRLDASVRNLIPRLRKAFNDSHVRLERDGRTMLVVLQRLIERAEASLDRVDPLGPLARGYAIVTKNGNVVRDVSQIRPGDPVNARLGNGTFAARVESVSPNE